MNTLITTPFYYSKRHFDWILNDFHNMIYDINHDLLSHIINKSQEIMHSSEITNKMLMEIYYAHPDSNKFVKEFNIGHKIFVQYFPNHVVMIDEKKQEHKITSAQSTEIKYIDKIFASYLESRDKGNPFDFPVCAADWEYYEQKLSEPFDEKMGAKKWGSIYGCIYNAY